METNTKNTMKKTIENPTLCYFQMQPVTGKTYWNEVEANRAYSFTKFGAREFAQSLATIFNVEVRIAFVPSFEHGHVNDSMHAVHSSGEYFRPELLTVAQKSI